MEKEWKLFQNIMELSQTLHIGQVNSQAPYVNVVFVMLREMNIPE